MSSMPSQVGSAGRPVASPGGANPRRTAVDILLMLVLVTSVLSLLYAIQYYAGGPLRIPTTKPVNDVALVPGGTIIAAGTSEGTVQVWDAGQNWSGLLLTGHRGPVTSLSFVPGSYTLYTTGDDGTIRQWSAATGAAGPVIEAGSGPLSDSSISADGSRLATAGEDGLVRVWDTATGQQTQALGAGGAERRAVAISADGRLVAAGDGSDIQVWDAASGTQVSRFSGRWEDEESRDTWLGHRKPVTALAFSPDGTLLASGAADATFVLWNVETGEVESTSDGHYGAVLDIVFSSDGKTVLTASQDTKARTWRVPGGRIEATYEGHLGPVAGVAFGTSGNTLITASSDGTVREWSTTSQKETHIEWTRLGLLPTWGRTLPVWFLISGLLGLVAWWGMRRRQTWSHLLALALYVIGPIMVVGVPLFEVAGFPLSWAARLLIAAPLLFLAALYIVLDVLLMREPVAMHFEAAEGLPLSQRLMASRRTAQFRLGIFGTAVWLGVLVILYSVLRRFNLDVAFMGHFFWFIMAGAVTTLYVSALSIALAVLLALLGALGRLSSNPIANGIASFYISLIRGTPLLVQVYIWYLGLPRLGIALPALVCGILALSVNYGAYMTETFRAGIQAIGKGQHEAAHALGMTGGQTFRRIVLPQAFRIVIPPIGNDFIAMMKDSSLISVITVWELTFRAQKIGRQYFRGLETLIVAALFYWLLTVVFQFLQGKLETYMARSERR